MQILCYLINPLINCQFVFFSPFADFFIAIDRVCGPLTLHSTLTDLVRYVKRGVKLLKDNAEIS